MKEKVLMILSRHVGQSRVIGMGELYTQVYGEPYENRINDTRKLRTLITALRQEGVPICSISDMNGGGYYLASATSDLDGYCERLRTKALKILSQEAKLREVALPDLMGQISINLAAEMEKVNA